MVWDFAGPAFCLLLWIIQHAAESLLLSAPEVVKATNRGSVTVPCQYDLQYKENTKYWCKGKIYEFCRIVVKTPKKRFNNRTFIADDKEAGVFSVTMTSIRQSDEDKYWCVIATSGRNIFTGVSLLVSQAGKLQLKTLYHQMCYCWFSSFFLWLHRIITKLKSCKCNLLLL